MRFPALNNFLAADKKRNITGFNLFPSNRDLSYISDNGSQTHTKYTVSFSQTPNFELANGDVQFITLTNHVLSSTITSSGGSSPTSGTVMTLHIAQDGTGHWAFQFPSNVLLHLGYEISMDPLKTTVVNLIYNGTNWEFYAPPTINPQS